MSEKSEQQIDAIAQAVAHNNEQVGLLTQSVADTQQQVEIVAQSTAKTAQVLVDFRNEMQEFKSDTNERFLSLEKGAFTETEKEDLMAIVRHINKRMEAETLGQSMITLERHEYDVLVEGAGLPNKFTMTPALID